MLSVFSLETHNTTVSYKMMKKITSKARNAYITEVIHSHPGNGYIEVGCLAPLTPHVFVVIFFVFKL